MFKLIKFLIVLAVLMGLAYLIFFVPLGEMTMYQHLVGISETEEARELGSELEAKAGGIKDELESRLPGKASDGAPGDDEGKAKQGESVDTGKDPLSELTEEDRAKLIELLQKKSDD